MGQVPVAVIKIHSNIEDIPKLKATLCELPLRNLGASYALACVFTLDDLGMADFPMTTSGKIRKSELKDIVAQRMPEMQQDERARDVGNVWE